MEIIRLDEQNVASAAARAAAVVQIGGVVLYPTETLYGLGADALSDAAVAKLYAIKGRPNGKPIHALVESEAMAAQYGELDANAKRLLACVRGPLSLVVKKKASLNAGILNRMDTFGFRIATHPLCAALVRAAGRPVTTTSANIAGKLPERSVEKILEQLGSGANGIDLVIDAGELPESEPSTIVDLSMDPSLDQGPVILREGVVPAADIWEAVRAE